MKARHPYGRVTRRQTIHTFDRNKGGLMVTRATLPALLAAAAIVTGCAGTKVSNVSTVSPAPGAPSMIYVTNFDLGAATLKEDPHTLTGRPRLMNFGDTDPAKKLEDLSDQLAKSLVEDLRAKRLPATRLAADAPRPASGWLVTGEFLEVAE